MGNVRVLPLVVFAGLCLFVLKAAGLFLSGGYMFSGTAPASAQNTQPATPAQNEPAGKQAMAAQKQEPQSEAKQKTANKQKPPEASLEKPLKMAGSAVGASKAELAILEGLRNRRKILDQRDRELGLRENLLKAADKRVEARIDELRAIESRIENVLKKRDDLRKAQYQRLVTMYSGMKAKDAARLFNRLELNVLVDLVSQMKPRVMSAILAAMTSSAAERLTLEIANRGKPKPRTTASLPKINSRQAN